MTLTTHLRGPSSPHGSGHVEPPHDQRRNRARTVDRREQDRQRQIILALSAAATGLAALGIILFAQTAKAAQTDAAPPPKTAIETKTIATGLENPWGLEFLPDGRYLVTEKDGSIKVITADGASKSSIKGVPTVWSRGQGGLLDITLPPDYAETGLVYLSYSEPNGSGRSRTAVAKAKLVLDDSGGGTLDDLTVIFRQTPAVQSGRHFGSRIVFADDGSLFITTGDRGTKMLAAQDASNTIGAVVRINPDGSPHKDNPKIEGWKPEIYSIGHRNIQGAAIDPKTGTLWTVEHGARGGDELNKPEPGKNYGWPIITHGRDYSGEKIGEGKSKAGLEQPVYYWTPSIATSGLEIVSGKGFPAWTGDILIGGLAGSRLSRLTLNADQTGVETEEVLLNSEGWRVRDIREGPTGAIYLLTDESNGSLIQITPRQPS